MQENPYLQNVHIKSNNQINYLGGGINTSYPSQYIQDDECEEMYNFSLDAYPALETRIGRGALIKLSETDGKIVYMGMANKYLFFIQGGKLKNASGGTIDENLGEYLFYYPYKHIYYKDGNNNEYLIIYNNRMTPRRYKLPLTSDSIAEELTLPNGVHRFTSMCYHKNRIVGSDDNMLYFSALQNPMDWNTANVTGEMRLGNCNRITGLVSFDDKLIAFSEHNMHLIYGSTPDEQISDLYSCVNLDNNIGCYSQNAILVYKGFLYWIYEKSIYEYDGSTIRAIEQPNANNGVTGGIQKYTEIFHDSFVEEGISIVGSGNKIYLWMPESPSWTPVSSASIKRIFLIFDQRLRKWTKELQAENKEEELYFTAVCGGEEELTTVNPVYPIYAVTKDCKVYNLSGGDTAGGIIGNDVFFSDKYTPEQHIFTSEEIPFYLKTKEFKNNVLSKKISLSQLWINYDLAIYGEVNIRITTDTGKTAEFLKVLPIGKNLTKCILIPNNIQNVNSYSIEIWGKGNFRIYGIERVDRTHTR